MDQTPFRKLLSYQLQNTQFEELHDVTEQELRDGTKSMGYKRKAEILEFQCHPNDRPRVLDENELVELMDKTTDQSKALLQHLIRIGNYKPVAELREKLRTGDLGNGPKSVPDFVKLLTIFGDDFKILSVLAFQHNTTVIEIDHLMSKQKIIGEGYRGLVEEIAKLRERSQRQEESIKENQNLRDENKDLREEIETLREYARKCQDIKTAAGRCKVDNLGDASILQTLLTCMPDMPSTSNDEVVGKSLKSEDGVPAISPTPTNGTMASPSPAVRKPVRQRASQKRSVDDVDDQAGDSNNKRPKLSQFWVRRGLVQHGEEV